MTALTSAQIADRVKRIEAVPAIAAVLLPLLELLKTARMVAHSLKGIHSLATKLGQHEGKPSETYAVEIESPSNE